MYTNAKVVALRPASSNGDEALAAIVGESLAAVALRRQIQRCSPITAPVLISGESGSGKELIARAIHACSNRAREPFVSVNAAAFSPGTIASELFGHARGAFTGASNPHRGVFEQANRGTLFLDEVADLAADVQAQLLRVLEGGEVRPLGSESTRRVDVRIVCATHRDLAAMVADGRFRADLHHRLRVLTITAPPLRERLDDMDLLARHLLAEHERDLGSRMIAHDAMPALLAYQWPGNVRQLGAVLVRAAVRVDGAVIDRDAIESVLAEERLATRDVNTEAVVPTPFVPNPADPLREALRVSHGKIAPAARALGIARSTLRDRLERLGIAVPEQSARR